MQGKQAVAKTARAVFDYRMLRLLMGLIALALPYVVIVLSEVELASISASYHSDARDAFVGMLFVVGSFLWAYNGHERPQAALSKVAAVAAVLVAVFPTACVACPESVASVIHFVASLVLFAILAYFCLGPFRKDTKGQPGRKGLRARIYLICGCVMPLALVGAFAAKGVLGEDPADELRVVYWGELVALNAFGFAWITAGKVIPALVDPGDSLFARTPDDR